MSYRHTGGAAAHAPWDGGATVAHPSPGPEKGSPAPRKTSVSGVTSFQSQHRKTLPNGVLVERLPLGYAAGRWWASFVYTRSEGVRISPDAWRQVMGFGMGP